MIGLYTNMDETVTWTGTSTKGMHTILNVLD